MGQPLPGLDSPGRIVEPLATGSRVPGHLGNAIGRPTPSLGSPGH